MKKKILVIFILYLIMSPLGESNWYHLFYTIAYMIAVMIYFVINKKKGEKK
ncbi:hypothetical protein [Streptococcus sp.]